MIQGEREYVSRGGTGCLFCGETVTVTSGPLSRTNNGIASQEKVCPKCEAEWEDVYELTNIELTCTPVTVSADVISVLTAKYIREFSAYLRNCTNEQVQGVYTKEKAAGRDAYVELILLEADRRQIT